MEGRIGPDNDTLVQFLDLDGDPNEGHHEADEAPPKPTVKPTNQAPEGDLEPAVEIDMGDAPPADAEEAPPAEPSPPPDTPTEEAGGDPSPPVDADAESGKAEDKLTPWQRNAQLKRELAEERRQREDDRKRLMEAQQQIQQIAQYLQRQAQQQAQPPSPPATQAQAPETQVPNFDENPLGHLAARQVMTEQQLQQDRERQARLEAQMVRRQFEERINQEEAVYAQTKNPAYYNARNWLIESAWKEGQAMGMNKQQIEETIEAYRVQFAQTAWSQNRPIAEVVEQVAVSRGYRPPVAEPTEAEQPPATRPVAAPQQKVQMAAQRERQANSSLANAARTTGRPSMKLTREMILAMDESEMDRLDQENPGWMERYLQSGPG